MTLQTENKQAETSVINNPNMGICLAERAIFSHLILITLTTVSYWLLITFWNENADKRKN